MSQTISLATTQSENQVKPYIIQFDTFGGKHNGGILTVAQQYSHVPFDIKRLYWIHDCSADTLRGQHACIRSQQVIMAIAGSAVLKLESQTGQVTDFVLENSSFGIFVPASYWREVIMQANTVLLCFSSIEYDPNDYINEYKTFKAVL